jgi:hypothetical protein
MASTRIIEEERGTYTGPLRRHNGYWAGDFTSTRTSGPTRPVPSTWR